MEISEALRRLRSKPDGRVVILTGAGISAESGIPTFRGPEGYWQPGNDLVPNAVRYRPEELATWEMFERAPELVWPWYLYRRGVCRAAEPNAAHRALVDLEVRLGERYQLVTQNVDGLHARAGSRRMFEIHGNIDTMRCLDDDRCGARTAVPAALDHWPKDRPWDEASRAALVCSRCGGPARPHVLWFDESYDEPNYRWESTHLAVQGADLLVVIGTAGATNLPNRMAQLAMTRGVPIIDINPNSNPFAALAVRSGGAALIGTACDLVPELVEKLT